MTYTPDELEYYFRKLDDEGENRKVQKKIFMELLARAKKDNLSYSESKYFCTILKHTYEDYGEPHDFNVCREHTFNNLFWIYYKDLHGVKELKDKWGNVLTSEQKKSDLKELDTFYREWENIIRTQNNNILIQQISRETNNEIRSLRKNPVFKISGIFYSSNKYKFQLKATILRSRFIKNITQEHIDKHGKIIEIKFNDRTVEFNEYSLAHIFFRHYAKIIKQTELEKSFHDHNIDYSNLGLEIKNILESIDESGKYKEGERSVYFIYKNKNYTIWISPEKEKSIEGISGMRKYFRIDTFYPIEDKTEEKKIDKLRKIQISDELILLQ